MTLRRFLFLLIAWCVLPLFVLATLLAGWHVGSARRDHDERSTRLAANAAALADRYVQARIEALALLARSPLADDPAQPDGLYRQAQAFVQAFDGDVALVSTDRRVLFDTALPLGTAQPPLPRRPSATSSAARSKASRWSRWPRRCCAAVTPRPCC